MEERSSGNWELWDSDVEDIEALHAMHENDNYFTDNRKTVKCIKQKMNLTTGWHSNICISNRLSGSPEKDGFNGRWNWKQGDRIRSCCKSQVRGHEGLIWEILWEVRSGNWEIYYFDIYWTLIVYRMLWEKLTIWSNFLCNALICFTTFPVSGSPVSDWILPNDRELTSSGLSQFPL